jgi:hypothetical protein
LIPTLLLGLFFLRGWATLDPDFGWHLRAGQYFVAHGIPAHDVFTYTARGFHWIDHEWGNDVVLAALYAVGGYALAALAYAAIWTVALLIAAPDARLLTFIAAAAALAPFAGVRPLAWTCLLVSVTLRALATDRRAARWSLPLMFAFWANLHAGFIVGLGLIAGRLVFRERRVALLALLVLCSLATLANPYGPTLYVEIARTLFDPSLHTRIAEWRALAFPASANLFCVLWCAGLAAFDRRASRAVDASPLLLAAALSAARNLPLFIVAATRELDGYVTTALVVLRAGPAGPASRFGTAVSTMMLGLALICSVAVAYLPLNLHRESGYPQAAVAYLRAHPCSGHLFNSYNYGGYLVWRLPTEPVFIDGRMSSWEPFMTNYVSLTDDPARAYNRVFRRYDVRCALLDSQSSKLAATLERSRWRPAVIANGATLLLAPAGDEEV